MTDRPDSTPADLLGERYQILRELGRGGMAVVYLARDDKHGREVAVKVMLPLIIAAIGTDRFLQEVAIAAQLQHPNLVGLIDSGETREANPCPFYVMPFIQGESLRQRLDREGELPLGEALRLMREMGDALHYAHGCGVVHRDIKPENVMLSHGHALVTDFGIARALGSAGSGRMTMTGVSLGTPAYMSPEQVGGGGQDIDARSDQYSLACVFYEMLTGNRPFGGVTSAQIMARHVLDPAPEVSATRPSVPEAVSQAVTRALAKLPSERFPDMAEFVKALDVAVTDERLVPLRGRSAPGASKPKLGPTATPRTGAIARLQANRAFRWVAGIAVVALAGFFGWKLFVGPSDRLPRLVVMPFRNLGQAGDVYFADGISDELTTRLSGLAGLSVIASTTALQYRANPKSVADIREELGVDYLIEGTVLWKRPGTGSDSVRVNARLVRARNGSQVWAEGFDVALADVFSLHSSIVSQVAERLSIVTLDPDKRRLAAQPTANMEAYDFYLRGNSSFDRSWSQADVESAVGFYQKAVELDSEYALALARLGHAHAWMYQLRYDRTENRLVESKRAVDRAMALDPESPDAHIAMGVYWLWGRQNHERALAQFDTAGRLRPSSAQVAQVALLTAHLRRRQGRFTDAITAYRRSAEVDPRSFRAWYNLGSTLLLTRKYAEAGAPLDRAIELNPNFLESYVQRARLAINWRADLAAAKEILRRAEERIPPTSWRATMLDFARVMYHPNLEPFLDRLRPGAYGLDSATYHVMKAMIYTQLDSASGARPQYDSARVQFERLREEQPDQAWIHGYLGVAYAGLGQSAEAVQSAKRAQELLPVSTDALDGPEWVINLGRVYALIGDYRRAAAYYDSALAMPSWISIKSLGVDPLLAPLRRDGSFGSLVSRWASGPAPPKDPGAGASQVAP